MVLHRKAIESRHQGYTYLRFVLQNVCYNEQKLVSHVFIYSLYVYIHKHENAFNLDFEMHVIQYFSPILYIKCN